MAEVLDGKHPWEHEMDNEFKFSKKLHNATLEARFSTLEGSLAEIVTRCIDWDPNNRPNFKEILPKLKSQRKSAKEKK